MYFIKKDAFWPFDLAYVGLLYLLIYNSPVRHAANWAIVCIIFLVSNNWVISFYVAIIH